MGNYSRNPEQELADALGSQYVRVRFQQGKPALDRELNLAADLASPQRLAAQYLGNGVSGTGGDFAISGLNVGANDFAIAAGGCLVNGLEVVLPAATSYQARPNRGNVAALPAGLSNVYLRVFEREVTNAGDARLANAGDVGFETSVRSRVDWEVVVSVPIIDQATHFLLATLRTAPPRVQDARRLGLRLGSASDEIRDARGSMPGLGARLNVAHAPSGTLVPNAVGTAQLVAQAVTTDKLAVGSVSASQLKRAQRFNGSVTIPPLNEAPITAFLGARHGLLSVSVIASGAPSTVSWREFSSQTIVNGAPELRRGILVRNEGTQAITVDIDIQELLPT